MKPKLISYSNNGKGRTVRLISRHGAYVSPEYPWAVETNTATRTVIVRFKTREEAERAYDRETLL